MGMEYKIAIISFIHSLAEKLKQVYQTQESSLEHAWWTVEAVTKKTKSFLLLHDTIQLSAAEYAQIENWVSKQINDHMPLAYLIGTVPFNGLEILVEPPTLIPRPETEEWCLDLIVQLQQLHTKELTILDLCTGSGCIAIALAKALPKAIIYAVDIADSAVALTKKNCAHNKVSNVHVVLSDLFEQLPANSKFDLIVSNPPYIASSEWKDLDEFVTQWEDPRALVATHDGLAILQEIIQQVPHFLRSCDEMVQKGLPQLVLEIGYQQADVVKKMMETAGFSSVMVTKDLAAKDRTVQGRIAYVASVSTL